MIAVIKTGGKQYRVSPKDKLKIEKIEGEEGAKVVFDQVFLVSSDDEKDVSVGNPVVANAKVEAVILKQGRARKIKVVKYKAKKRYNVENGHRQHFTEVEIMNVVK